MKDDFKSDESQLPQDEEETPNVYSRSHADGETKLSRRTFLELAAVAATTSALHSGCATLAGLGQTGPAIAHKSAVTALAVNTAGNLLASGDKDGTLKLWQLPQGVLLNSWEGYKSTISDLTFPLMEDELWSLNSYGTLKRWHLPDCKESIGGASMSGMQLFAVPSSADWYALRTTAGDMELRSQTTGEKLFSLTGFNDTVNALAVTSDGRLLLAGGANGNLGLWIDPAGDKSLQIVKSGPSAVSALAISSDGKLALSAHADAQLRTWQMPKMQPGAVYQSNLGKPFCVAIRPQMDLFVVGSEKPEIGLWKLSPAVVEAQILMGHSAAVPATVITPDGTLLISGSEDKTIRLWSLPDGKYLRNLVDMSINYKYIEGTSYKGTDVYGRTITYTLPCGSPIPPGAVCTCNCVPGAMTIPRNNSQRYDARGYCTCDLICTCNTVCTCQSVGRGRTYYISYWYPN